MRILHLSDPQFGRFHRDGPTVKLIELLIDRKEQIDLVALTGDLAEWSKPAEYTQGIAWLDRLASGLGLSRERVLVVPGNHDVSRTRYLAYKLECEERDGHPEHPFWPKWHYYVDFLNQWYGPDRAHFLPGEPWSWWEIPALELVVAGFNSTMQQTDEVDDWALGEEQIRWLGERLARSGARYRLGLVHHDLFHGAEAASRERERLRDLPLSLILHGHTHTQTSQEIREAPVLGVGSLGVEKEWREEDVANQVQLLTIEGDRLDRRLLRYYGPKRGWIPDDSVLSAADRSMALPTFGRSRSHESRLPEGFAGRVAEVLRLREAGAEVTVLDAETVQVRQKLHRRLYGAVEQPDQAAIDRYLVRLAPYRADDPTLPAELVRRGPTEDRGNIVLRSLAELQGLVDFGALRRWQAQRMAEDPRYPADRYIPQRIRIGRPHPGEADAPQSALDLVHGLLTEEGDHPRLALVLAPFGTGKTFLVRQLARRLETDWEVGARVPIWIELRHLEKASSFEALLAAHLSRAGQRRIDHDQLRYLRREGRVVLLFDGFDELVLRVSYDRATEHLQTLADAAEGRARVVVTSRTEHFLRTADAEGALLRRLSGVEGLRVLHIQPFDEAEAGQFLRARMGDRGERRLARLRAIPNLLELAQTPRMLSMLADLEEADLDAAERQAGPITAAGLYGVVIERWLKGEEEKRSAPGAMPPIGWQSARLASGRLAERAWRRGTEDLGVDELREVAASFDHPTHTTEEAARELGVGTLLVRDEEARFRFAHRSMLEFFVAESCATALRAGEKPELLDQGEVSATLVRFLGELAGEALDDWAREAAQPGSPELRRGNALAVVAARGLRLALDLSGQDLRGRDDLRTLDLRGADLSGADLRGLDLSEVDLSGAVLTGARLEDTRLTAARLDGVVGLEAGRGQSGLDKRNCGRSEWLVGGVGGWSGPGSRSGGNNAAHIGSGRIRACARIRP